MSIPHKKDQSSESANLFSNFWLTSINFVPWSGAIVFHGVGLFLVQTTTWKVSGMSKGSNQHRRTRRSQSKTAQIPASTNYDSSNNHVAECKSQVFPNQQHRALTSEWPNKITNECTEERNHKHNQLQQQTSSSWKSFADFGVQALLLELCQLAIAKRRQLSHA